MSVGYPLPIMTTQKVNELELVANLATSLTDDESLFEKKIIVSKVDQKLNHYGKKQ